MFDGPVDLHSINFEIAILFTYNHQRAKQHRTIDIFIIVRDCFHSVIVRHTPSLFSFRGKRAVSDTECRFTLNFHDLKNYSSGKFWANDKLKFSTSRGKSRFQREKGKKVQKNGSCEKIKYTHRDYYEETRALLIAPHMRRTHSAALHTHAKEQETHVNSGKR